MPPAGLHSPITLTTGPVEITFSWSGDRWSHRVAIRGAGTWESVEGPRPTDGDPRWPASPVLVELSWVETAHGPAILGVGLAGRSHFSASIGHDPDAPGRVRFDIACRINEPAVWLGSTYRGPDGVVSVQPRMAAAAVPATARWDYFFGPGGLVRPDPSAASEARP
jgi:hypothetical protein